MPSAVIGSSSLSAIIDATSELPSFSPAALRVARESAREFASSSDIAEALARDASLSLRVLRLANSAFFGMRRKVGDLREAVSVLGTVHVRRLALVAASYPWLSRALPGYGFGAGELLSHSLAVATIAQRLARLANLSSESFAFTAGLLHDVGKILVASWHEDSLPEVISIAASEGIPLQEAESRWLGFDHAQAGAELARRWNLPEIVCHAIEFHHEPERSQAEPLADCVHIADALAIQACLGAGGDGLRCDLDSQAWHRLELDPFLANELMKDLASAFETTSEWEEEAS